MSDTILVTDSLFIQERHVRQIEAAGFRVERLGKSKASEDELCAAIKGKVGYILGGTEKITDRVIAAADELKAIVLTVTAWQAFMPGYEAAAKRGILVANTPHANAGAVAEWAFAASLALLRDLFTLGRTGTQTYHTTRGLTELQVGIVGFGHVGSAAATLYQGAGAARVVYWNRSAKDAPFDRLELDELLKTSDIVCVSVGHGAGKLLSADKLALMKDSAILTAIEDAMDEAALLERLQAGTLKACLDWTPKDEAYQALPFDIFYCSNESTAYNTEAANDTTSDWATESLINLLTTGTDTHLVK